MTTSFADSVITKITIYDSLYVFQEQGIYFWYYHKDILHGQPQKSRSISCPGDTRKYWWFCRMNFHNFSNIYVSKVEKYIVNIPTKLPCLGDLKKSRSTSCRGGTWRYYLWLCPIDFNNFFLHFMLSRSRNNYWHSYRVSLFEWPGN